MNRTTGNPRKFTPDWKLQTLGDWWTIQCFDCLLELPRVVLGTIHIICQQIGWVGGLSKFLYLMTFSRHVDDEPNHRKSEKIHSRLEITDVGWLMNDSMFWLSTWVATSCSKLYIPSTLNTDLIFLQLKFVFSKKATKNKNDEKGFVNFVAFLENKNFTMDCGCSKLLIRGLNHEVFHSLFNVFGR